MGRGEENLEILADAGKEGELLPWRFRWHLADRESWSPRFGSRDVREMSRTVYAGMALEPFVRRALPDVAQWLDAHSQEHAPSVGWRLLRRTIVLLHEATR